MATICKINEPEQKMEYPCYGISNDCMIVLFSGKGEGTVIRKGDDSLWKVAAHTDMWDMSLFKPFKGTFTAGNV